MMAKPRELTIKESASQLQALRKKQRNFKFEKRFKTRKALSEYLDISPKSSERWSLKYIENGITFIDVKRCPCWAHTTYITHS